MIHLFGVPWYLGKKTEKYDAFGPRLDALEEQHAKIAEMRNDLKWIRAALKQQGLAAPQNGDD